MRNVNYSFIVPHKNSHQLLNRCLKSIPQRDDLEIIVVDDYSRNYEEVERIVAQFPCVELFTNEGSGAGGARNTGLSKAKGKWLLFADCDDFYVDGFLDELDRYAGSDLDVLYFNFFQYIEGQSEPVYEKISNTITEYVAGRENIDSVKYRNNAPWDKMVRRDFVVARHILFEEQPIGNDIFFSYQIAYLSKQQKIIDKKLYNYIVHKHSLTKRNWDQYKIKTFLENQQKYNGFMEFIGHKEWTHGFMYLCVQLYKMRDYQMIVKSLWYYFYHLNEIHKAKDKYPKLLNHKMSLSQ